MTDDHDESRRMLIYGYASFTAITGALIGFSGDLLEKAPSLDVALTWAPPPAWGVALVVASLGMFSERARLRAAGAGLTVLWCCLWASTIHWAWRTSDGQIYPLGVYGGMAWTGTVVAIYAWKRRDEA